MKVIYEHGEIFQDHKERGLSKRQTTPKNPTLWHPSTGVTPGQATCKTTIQEMFADGMSEMLEFKDIGYLQKYLIDFEGSKLSFHTIIL